MESARRVLGHVLPEYLYILNPGYFLGRESYREVMALTCNIANMLAKSESCDWYDEKNILTDYLARTSSQVWSRGDDSLLYYETSVGQVSFHVFSDQDWIAYRRGLSGLTLHYEGREWSGNEGMQRYAIEYFLDWTRNYTEREHTANRFFEVGMDLEELMDVQGRDRIRF